MKPQLGSRWYLITNKAIIATVIFVGDSFAGLRFAPRYREESGIYSNLCRTYLSRWDNNWISLPNQNTFFLTEELVSSLDAFNYKDSDYFLKEIESTLKKMQEYEEQRKEN